MEELLEKKISIKELMELCKKYDREEGTFPENRFEGMEVFREIIYYLFKIKGLPYPIDEEGWEIFEKELEVKCHKKNNEKEKNNNRSYT